MTASAAPLRSGGSGGACSYTAIAAVLLVFLWTTLRIHYVFGGNWTALFCTGSESPVPSELESDTYRFRGTGGYDGQMYRYLAHDPFRQKGYTRYMDGPQLRVRRILVPFAAWLLGFGQRAWIDGAYVAVEMIFLALGVYWCARLLERRGRSPAWGLLFVAVPGTLASFDRMLLDGPLAALFAGFLLYSEEQRWNRVWVIAMLAALTRETGLLLIASLVAHQLLRRDWRRAAWFASSAGPAIAWYGYLATRLPTVPVQIFSFPAWGLFQRLFVFRSFPDPRVQWLVRVTDVLAVLGLVLSIVLAVRWIQKHGCTPVTLSVGLFVALALVLGSPAHMIEAYGFGRPVSPLLLWVMIEAVSSSQWAALAPPLLVSLSVSVAFGSPLVTVIKGLLSR
jgi:hypothetical protein